MKLISIFTMAILFSFPSFASLTVNCKMKNESIAVKVNLQSYQGNVVVSQGNEQLFSATASNTYDGIWGGVLTDATVSGAKQYNGVKLYFETNDASIRFYGSLRQKLFPTEKDNINHNIDCDEPYEFIKNEVDTDGPNH